MKIGKKWYYIDRVLEVVFMNKLIARPGIYFMGAIVLDAGVNFGIFSRNATSMTLHIFEHSDDCEPCFSYKLDKNVNKTGDIWHVYVEGMTEGYYYGWIVDGPFDSYNFV